MSVFGRVVAVGGGTGLPVVLSSLKEWTEDLTAVVTMADDGGSSGRLRRELNVLPPGDIRNCLVALADEDNELLPLFKYRFSAGEGLAEHNLGNLIITAFSEKQKGMTGAIEIASRLLDVKGKVLPSTLDQITLYGTTTDGFKIKGQSIIARSGPLDRVIIDPEGAEAYKPAVDAIEDADSIILGPGSLFTSIIPVLLVKGVSDAIKRSAATKVYVCNTVNQRKETEGYAISDYMRALESHAGGEIIDTVIVNDSAENATSKSRDAGLEYVGIDQPHRSGVDVIKAHLVDDNNPLKHDPVRLRRVLHDVLSHAGAYG